MGTSSSTTPTCNYVAAQTWMNTHEWHRCCYLANIWATVNVCVLCTQCHSFSTKHCYAMALNLGVKFRLRWSNTCTKQAGGGDEVIVSRVTITITAFVVLKFCASFLAVCCCCCHASLLGNAVMEHTKTHTHTCLFLSFFTLRRRSSQNHSPTIGSHDVVVVVKSLHAQDQKMLRCDAAYLQNKTRNT